MKVSKNYFEHELNNWKYRDLKGSVWKFSRKNASCTEIYADLLANKEISDPFLNLNEREVQWVAERDWVYSNTFNLDFDLESLQYHEITFEGLDTFATVYLNGEKILTTNNMFRSYRVEVKGNLKFGEDNILKIVFKSALLEGRNLEKNLGQLSCFNGESSRLYVRKAQYHYGWDWGPVLMSCGPYKPVKVQLYNSMIQEVSYETDVHDLSKAHIEFKNQVITKGPIWLTVNFFAPSGESAGSWTTKVNKSGCYRVRFMVPSPLLWYPCSHGPVNLYTCCVAILDDHGRIIQELNKRVGIRKLELIKENLDDEPGSSFYFKVNDIPIYCTGSNWIPAHSLQTLLTDEDYKEWLRLLVNGNQNMIRVWGGGLYERDVFYDECDNLGILVWQDFMFACGQYPGYKEFVSNVTEEAICQIKRLRNHCSIVIYAGNNEDYQVAEQLHLDWDQNDHSGDYSKTNFPARTIYENTLPTLLEKLSPNVPYQPGSPWGGKRTDDSTVGDIHQWNVWHGTQEKYQNWYKLCGRFVSEFGMEALPCRHTLECCITNQNELYPQSKLVDYHNKADGFERRLALYVMENIKVDSMDLDSWIYASQLMQAECLGYAYRCWRRNWKGNGKRNTGGALVWQINDCWPATSWAVCDFFKRPKLGYYAIKRESNPIEVGIFRNGKRRNPLTIDKTEELPRDDSIIDYSFDVWGVNSGLKEKIVILKLSIYDITSGKLLMSLTDKSVVLKANQSTELITNFPLKESSSAAISARFLSEQSNEVTASASDFPQPLKYLKFPNRKIAVKIEDGLIKISSDKPVKGVELTLDREVTFDDNGFDLFPNEEKVVRANSIKRGDKVDVRYYQMEL